MASMATSITYRLTKPGVFEEININRSVEDGFVVVEPMIVSVCHADIRYFTGNRRKEALESKLPMALFHEGVGKIVESKDADYKIGDRVIIIPTIPGYVLEQKEKSGCCNSCKRGGPDNYCENGVFLGSGYDGIGQSRLVLPSQNVIRIPNNISNEIAVLAELCSVSLYAINQLSLDELEKYPVAVFGDGPVGFLTAAMLHYYCNVPQERLIVFGAVENKLAEFDFATTYNIRDYDFTKQTDIHTVFECTGGPFSESAINQAIDIIARNGNLSLLGVTEERVPINTRDILEKGIKVFGSSRSTYNEFSLLMQVLQNENLQKTLAKLIPKQNDPITDVTTLTDAMNRVVENKGWKRTYLSFKWE